MAVESIGRTDDGVAWEVRHRLGGQWWWTMRLPDGAAVQSPDLYDTEAQALDAVADARRQVLAGLPPVETMASLRARAEAAEQRAAVAEADARLVLPMCLFSRGGVERDDLSPPEWSGLGLLLQRFLAAPRGDIAAAVRRILASVTV